MASIAATVAAAEPDMAAEQLKDPSVTFRVPCPPHEESEDDFRLVVPLADLRVLVRRPIRWMHLVAWGILNCHGEVHSSAGVLQDRDMDIDALNDGDEFLFVVNPGETELPLNFVHTRTLDKGTESETSSSDVYPDPAPLDRDSVLNDRDGRLCVFSGYRQAHHAHVLPKPFSQQAGALQALSRDRAFAIEHHLDPATTITMYLGLHYLMDSREAFILATDDIFLRDGDIPQPAGPSCGTASWQTRPQPSGPTNTFIWQILPAHMTGIPHIVRPNERARFRNAASASLPSPSAVNYVYVAGMLDLYLDKNTDSFKLLSRPVSPSPDNKGDSVKRQQCGDTVRHRRSRPCEMDSIELLFRLTHGGRYLDYYDAQRKLVEAEKICAIDKWRLSLPNTDTGET
ncbi:hypothetical protein AURDEDRAFT_174931 [Auricularia subglabra TFB-10046 SS5]|uniref:HNH nuclease domain-containing protein n=1 Tax=Auricularia subglabra (strain TFB-10046 / SS5) TaxID=717982 RepID=J0WTV6_AURST|nr:hypothetical protein AURDEDRAFT_174931 [Auricularia subglabra TFB-10046 SS5]